MTPTSPLFTRFLGYLSRQQPATDPLPSLSVSFDPLFTYILLGITIAALLLSILAIFIDRSAARVAQKRVTFNQHAVTHAPSTNNSTFVRSYGQRPADEQHHQSHQQQQQQQSSQPNSTTHNFNDNNNNVDSPSENHDSSQSSPGFDAGNTGYASSPDGLESGNGQNDLNIPPSLPSSANNHLNHNNTSDEANETENGHDVGRGGKSNRKKKAKNNAPRPALRALIITILARLLFCALLLGSIVISIYLLAKAIQKGPLYTLAHRETNEWVYSLVQHAVRQYAALTNRPELTANSTTLGVGSRMMEPGPAPARQIWQWILLFVVIIVYVCVGAFVRLGKGLVPTSNVPVAVFMLVQLVVWISISLTATFVFPTRLPLHSTALRNFWLDKRYASTPMFNLTGEDRFISNFYITLDRDSVPPVVLDSGSGPPDNSSNVGRNDTDTAESQGKSHVMKLNLNDDLPNFAYPFCYQFVKRTPTTIDEYPIPEELFASPEPSGEPQQDTEQEGDDDEGSGDDVQSILAATDVTDGDEIRIDGSVRTGTGQEIKLPKSAITLNQDAASESDSNASDETLPLHLYNEVFLVYAIGKPMGADHYQALGYMMLPMMTLGPCFVAHLLFKFYLFPFAVLWMGLVGLLAILGTPSVLRVITAPNEADQILTFCRLNYRVRVLDDKTAMISRMDMAVFALTIVITLFEVVRWMRESDYQSPHRRNGDSDRRNFDQVSGPLRW